MGHLGMNPAYIKRYLILYRKTAHIGALYAKNGAYLTGGNMRKKISIRVIRLFILFLLACLSSSGMIAHNVFADSEPCIVFKQYFSEVRECANYDEYESVTRKYAYSDMIKKMDSPAVKSLPKEFKEKLFSMVKNQFFDEEELIVLEEEIQGNQACIKYTRKDHHNLNGTATLIKENGLWKIKKVSEEIS
jgi:hypothetical protein